MKLIRPIKSSLGPVKERYIAMVNKGIAIIFYRLANAYKRKQITAAEFNVQMGKWHGVYKNMLNRKLFINKEIDKLNLLETAGRNFLELAEGFAIKMAGQNEI